MDLPRGVVQKVGAPYHVRHALGRIVDHDGQHVREQLVAASDQHIADGGGDVLAERSLNAIRELNGGLVDADSRRAGSVRLQRALATVAGIAVVFRKLQSTARTLEGQSARTQDVERRCITVAAMTLVHRVAVPFEAEPAQGSKYSDGGSR